jgi:hypothetical protein
MCFLLVYVESTMKRRGWQRLLLVLLMAAIARHIVAICVQAITAYTFFLSVLSAAFLTAGSRKKI